MQLSVGMRSMPNRDWQLERGLLFLHAALEGEEGRVLQEEGSECTGGGAGDGIALVAATAGAGESGGGGAEAAQEGIEGEGNGEAEPHPIAQRSSPKVKRPETVLSIQALQNDGRHPRNQN